MIHRVSQRKLSRSINSRKALLKNLANDLILRERIVTTQAKAKTVRPFVEKLITRSKDNSITSRRILVAKLGRENSAKKLLELVGPTFKERPGGYTRIIKLPSRVGDRAQMAVIEFSENVSEKAAKQKLEGKPKKVKEKPAEIRVKGKKETKPKTIKKKIATPKTKKGTSIKVKEIKSKTAKK